MLKPDDLMAFAMGKNTGNGGGGEGGNSKWRLIESITLTDSTTSEIIRAEEPDGTPYSFEDICIKFTNVQETSTASYWLIRAFHNTSDRYIGLITCNGSPRYGAIFANNVYGRTLPMYFVNSSSGANGTSWQTASQNVAMANDIFPITKLVLSMTNGSTFKEGSQFDIYGIEKIGAGGSSNYSDLSNKPSINGIELAGNKTADDLGLVNQSYVQQMINSKVSFTEDQTLTDDQKAQARNNIKAAAGGDRTLSDTYVDLRNHTTVDNAYTLESDGFIKMKKMNTGTATVRAKSQTSIYTVMSVTNSIQACMFAQGMEVWVEGDPQDCVFIPWVAK